MNIENWFEKIFSMPLLALSYRENQPKYAKIANFRNLDSNL